LSHIARSEGKDEEKRNEWVKVVMSENNSKGRARIPLLNRKITTYLITPEKVPDNFSFSIDKISA